jgi:hypothetical protein
MRSCQVIRPSRGTRRSGRPPIRRWPSCWRGVADERGLDFEPAPAPVIAALPRLTLAVEDLAGRCSDVQEQRWLAAALAALSRHVQVSTPPEPLPPEPSNTPDLAFSAEVRRLLRAASESPSLP